jgi:hypothetical protein
MSYHVNDAYSKRDEFHRTVYDVLFPFATSTGREINQFQGICALISPNSNSFHFIDGDEWSFKFNFYDATIYFFNRNATDEYTSAESSLVKTSSKDQNSILVSEHLTGKIFGDGSFANGMQFNITNLEGHNVIKGGLRFFNAQYTNITVSLNESCSLHLEEAYSEKIPGYFDVHGISMIEHCTLTVEKNAHCHHVISMRAAPSADEQVNGDGKRICINFRYGSQISADITGETDTGAECFVNFSKGCVIKKLGDEISKNCKSKHGTFALKGKLTIWVELGASTYLLEQIHKAVCANIIDIENITARGEYLKYIKDSPITRSS